nr:putative reverse transcriptase domain, ribonuclease H-like domain protein [Tanacetum cinerariifolium]
MQETELPKKLKKKEMIQLSLDEELTQKLYAKELAKDEARQENERYNLEKALELQRQLDQRKENVPKGSSKKQRLDQQTEEAEAQGDSDQEVEVLKLYMRIIPKEDIEIKAIPLAVKPPMIIEYKIVKEGSTRRYTSMINLLKNIDREDLETLWKLVKDKYGNTRQKEGYERVLWGDLKVMFEPDIKSEVWRQLQGHDVTVWKLFSSCGVHFVKFKHLHIFLMVDKVYPLTPATIKMMDQQEPHIRRRMRALRLQGMVTQLNYLSEDVDREREIEAPQRGNHKKGGPGKGQRQRINKEEVVRSGKLAHLIKRIKKGKAKQAYSQLEEWIALTVKAEQAMKGKADPILMMDRNHRIRDDPLHDALSSSILVRSRTNGHYVRIPRRGMLLSKDAFQTKNAGATYQRLVDKVFERQIERNMKAYIDDMAIKSVDETNMMADIRETFERLQKINMKLSLKRALLGWKKANS